MQTIVFVTSTFLVLNLGVNLLYAVIDRGSSLMSSESSLQLDKAVAEPIAPRRTSWYQNLRGLPIVPLVIRSSSVPKLAPVIQPHDPNKVDLLGSLKPPVGFGGTWTNPWGRTSRARRVSRLMDGARLLCRHRRGRGGGHAR